MTTELRTFNPRAHTSIDMDIRVVDHDGEPWFAMTDVCKALGYKNPSEMARPIDSMEKAKKFLGKGAPATIISEAGLYQVLLRTQRTNPKARDFQDWVTKVVLPTIRKTGSYSVDSKPSPAAPVDERIERLEVLVERLADGMATMATAMRQPEKQQEIAAQAEDPMVTMGYFEGLTHRVLTSGYKQELASKAKRLARAAGLETGRALVTNYRSYKHPEYGVNTYPLSTLHEADRLLAQ